MSTPGQIVWTDLTVSDADNIRQFYCDVIGWSAEPLSMGDYDDYVLYPGEGKDGVAGVCHARGINANVPPQWLIYVTVTSVAASVERCLAAGGRVLDGPRNMSNKPFCVIQDPAGAVIAIIEL
ncbi:MAG: VOC family protein [Bacteroidia bacterium]|nr:VOC family protein [Bacteroidia bacterium]